jgi:hypothetical protein
MITGPKLEEASLASVYLNKGGMWNKEGRL